MLTLIPQKEHKIQQNQLNRSALTVAKKLTEAGYESYLVGGCVRDLLVDQKPKDFDIATSALPEEVEALFRQCRLIGRRFRLAHVRIGKEVIEVATFRGSPQASNNAQNFEAQNLEDDKDTHNDGDHSKGIVIKDGLVVRDNCYGSIEEDAGRRDYTINALYLDPNTLEIRDYINAMPDIAAERIRLIGKPEIRFREDPVRTLRAIRFESKLGFKIEKETADTLGEHLPLLNDISPARRFEELLKLLLTGHAKRSFELLKHYNALQYLLPTVAEHFSNEQACKLFDQALINTDNRISIGKHVTPAFILSVFLWPSLIQLQSQYMSQKVPVAPALHKAASDLFDNQVKFTSIPRRYTIAMREIWELQHRLTVCNLKRCEALVQQRRFRAGYDFLLLREDSGEIEAGLGDWWTKYQEACIKERKLLVESRQLKTKPKKKNRKKR